MSLWERLLGVWRDDSVSRIYTRIPPDRADGGFGGESLIPQESYVRMMLTEMRIQNLREGWRNYYPAVHSFSKISYANSVKEVPYVAGPGQLNDLDPTRLDRVINVNHVLLGPLPYLGGQVEVLTGLFSVSEQDYAKQLLGVLGSISSVAGVQPLQTALNFLDPLKQGIEGLLNLGDFRLEIGYHDTFVTGAPPEVENGLSTGYIAVIDAETDQRTIDSLCVKGGHLRRMEGSSLTDIHEDFLLLKIEGPQKFEDWQRLPLLLETSNAAVTAAINGNAAEIDRTKKAFSQIVLTSPDLIQTDKVRLIEGLRTTMKQIQDSQEVPTLIDLTGSDTDVNESVRALFLADAPTIQEARMMDLTESLDAFERGS
jgi:hypothetical protein